MASLIKDIKDLVLGWVYSKDETYTKTVIDDLLEDKSDSNHNHDSIYYTETEIDAKIQEIQQAAIEGEVDLSNYALVSHVHGNINNDGSIGTSANVPLITTTNGKVTTGSFESTATNIKMDGTQAVGSLNTFARGDHVHPTDTSRAAASHTHTKSDISDFPTSMTPNSHAHGNITNVGAIGSTANLPIITGTNGVLKASSFESTATNIKMDGTQAVGSLNTFARGDHVHPTDTSRAAASHTHGNILNEGTMTTSDTSTTFTSFTGINSSNKLIKASKLNSAQLIDTTEHSNIGSSANATQSEINTAIDTALSNKASTSTLSWSTSTISSGGSDYWTSATVPNCTIYYNDYIAFCEFTGTTYNSTFTQGTWKNTSAYIATTDLRPQSPVVGTSTSGTLGVQMMINTSGYLQIRTLTAGTSSATTVTLNGTLMWRL